MTEGCPALTEASATGPAHGEARGPHGFLEALVSFGLLAIMGLGFRGYDSSQSNPKHRPQTKPFALNPHPLP